MTGFKSKRGMAQAKTSMKDEALKLALQALEEAQTNNDGPEYWDRNKNAITAIKQALAQPVQPNEADELLTALGLDPDTYRTDGGWLNIPKIIAAIKSPQDYPHLEHVLDSSCWCNPDVNYVDPDTGAAVIVHKEPN